MAITNDTPAALALSSELNSLQSQVKTLRTIAGLSLAGVVILSIVVSILMWECYHNQRQKKKTTSSGDLGSNSLPDPSVFELGNINRNNGSTTGGSNDYRPRTVHQRAVSSPSMHNTPGGTMVNQDLPRAIPHSHTIHAPAPQRPAPGQIILNLTQEDRHGRRFVSAAPAATAARVPLPPGSSEPGMPPVAAVRSPRRSRPAIARTSNTEQSFGTDYTRTRRVGRFDDDYFNEQGVSNSRDLNQGSGDSSRQGGSRTQRMLDRIYNA